VSQSLAVELDSIRLEAFPNGRGSVPVTLLELGDLKAHERVKLDDPAERAQFVRRHLPPSLHAAADEGLLELAAAVSKARAVAPAGRPNAAAPAAARTVVPPDPDPWPEAVDGAELLGRIVAYLARYVLLPPAGQVALALWAVHTYALAASRFTPYVHLRSAVRACGKSTAVAVVSVLVKRPLKADAISPAALRRLIEAWRPTVILDEFDMQQRADESGTLRGILNSGFEATGAYYCCDGDSNEPRCFPTFCPKLLAGIGGLADTVQSRTITIRITKARGTTLAGLHRIRGDRLMSEAEPIRGRLMSWAADHLEDLEAADPAVPPELDARAADVWRPLLAIADAAGGTWPQDARASAVSLSKQQAADENDRGLLVLADLQEIFARRGLERLPTGDILLDLHALEHRPWPEASAGRPLSARGLAALLGRFGLRPEHWRDGSATCRGWTRAQLVPVWVTYLPGPDQTGTSDTSAAPDTSKFNEDNAVPDVPENPGPPVYVPDATRPELYVLPRDGPVEAL
jgi:hypothetical protein